MELVKKLMRSARRVRSKTFEEAPAENAQSTSSQDSHRSYQEYHRELFRPVDDNSSRPKGPLQIRNLYPFKLFTKSPSKSPEGPAQPVHWPEPFAHRGSEATWRDPDLDHDNNQESGSHTVPWSPNSVQSTRANALDPNSLLSGEHVSRESIPLTTPIVEHNNQEVNEQPEKMLHDGPCKASYKQQSKGNMFVHRKFNNVMPEHNNPIASQKAPSTANKLQHKRSNHALRMSDHAQGARADSPAPSSVQGVDHSSQSSLFVEQRLVRQGTSNGTERDMIPNDQRQNGRPRPPPFLSPLRRSPIPTIPSYFTTPPTPGPESTSPVHRPRTSMNTDLLTPSPQPREDQLRAALPSTTIVSNPTAPRQGTSPGQAPRPIVASQSPAESELDYLFPSDLWSMYQTKLEELIDLIQQIKTVFEELGLWQRGSEL